MPETLLLSISGLMILVLITRGASALGEIMDKRRASVVMALCLIAVSAANAFLLPLSPSGDAFFVLNSLRYLMNGMGYTEHGVPYFSFNAGNKIVLLIYYAACRLTGHIEYAVRTVNFLLACGASAFISLSCAKIIGKRPSAVPALIFPYIIVTGAYIYIVGIFLASAAFYLCLSERAPVKASSIVFIGLLLAIRPTAAIFIFVYLFISAVVPLPGRPCLPRQKASFLPGVLNCLKRFRQTNALFLLCAVFGSFAVRWAVGQTMYAAGLHPYPNLENSALTWTLDLGTRLDGKKTGLCVYTPEKTLKNDLISEKMSELWAYYKAGDPGDYEKVKSLNAETTRLILSRAADTIKKDPSVLRDYVYYKTRNLFREDVNPYFYEINYNSPTFEWELYANLTADSLLYFDALLASFVISMIVLLGLRLIKKTPPGCGVALISCAVGVFATFVTFILLTEVGKRCVLDAFVPMSVVVCAVTQLAELKKFPRTLIAPLLPPLAAVCLYIFHLNDLEIFRNAQSGVTWGSDTVTIELRLEREPNENEQYSLAWGNTVVPITQNTVIQTPLRTVIYLRAPNWQFKINGVDLDY